EDPYSLSSDHVIWIQENNRGDLMIGSWHRGVQIFDREKNIFREIPEFHDIRVTSFLEDQEGKFWFGTWDDGLYCKDFSQNRTYHFKSDPTDPNSLSSDNISSLFEDRSGMIWIGTLYGGVNLCYQDIDQFEIIKDFPVTTKNKIVFSIFEDNQHLWIGAFKNGLIHLDRRTHTYKQYSCPGMAEGESSNTLLSIFQDRRGLLWLGSYRNGLHRFDPQKKSYLPPLSFIQNDLKEVNPYRNDTIRSIIQDHDGSIWIATDDNGLLHLDEDGGLIHNYLPADDDLFSLTDRNIKCLFLDQEQTLWIGTENGLNAYDRSQDRFRRYTSDSKERSTISHNRISCIQETENGDLWIGTEDGLNQLDRQSQTFLSYFVSDGLPCNKIAGILEDSEGNLWVSTNNGISKFNPRTKRFKNFDKNDGLQDNEFASRSYWKNDQGELFFGGMDGLTAFFPSDISINMHVPLVVITSFEVMGKSIHVDQMRPNESFLIPYSDKYFSVEFSALDFTNPMKNQYAYKLEGFNSDWIYCGERRFASYTNLDPGEYTLRIKGSNNDGVWNEDGVSLPIVVLPPFWMTWWFRASVLLLIAAAILCWYWMHLRELIKNQKRLSEQVELRTQELRQKNLELEKSMDERQKAMEKIKILSGFIPICSSCKKVRTDEGYWNQIEEYIKEHSEADFTHSLCPECTKKLYPDFYLPGVELKKETDKNE
ncbi:MAG: ligand-binding sensor domain-containing protein, partial [Candidatus Hinthialibacter sp.]